MSHERWETRKTVSGAILAAGPVVAQQQHSPPAGAHLFLLAGLVVAVLAIFGVKWWRRRHGSAARSLESTPDDRRPGNTPSRDETTSDDGSPERTRPPKEQ